MRLAPCPSCSRHVRVGDSVCVFCAAPRAAIAGVALVVALGAGAVVGCADPAPPVAPVAPLYGGPPPGPEDRDVDAGAPVPPSASATPQPTAPTPPNDPTRAAPAYGLAPRPTPK